MKVSVIIPTYNRANYILDCLESLTLQTFKDFEVLVCDDGSTDDTKQIIKKFVNDLDIKYFYLDNTGSPAAPRNVGIKNARGKYIAFLDSDDWWSPDKLQISVQELEKGFDLIFHDMNKYYENDHSRSGILKSRALKENQFRDLWENGNAMPCSSVICSTSIFQKVGLFCEGNECIAAEDYDMWLRIARANFQMSRIDGNHGFYRMHDKTISTYDCIMRFSKFLEYKYCSRLLFFFSNQPKWMIYNYIACFFKTKRYGKLVIILVKAFILYPTWISKMIISNYTKIYRN